MWRDVSTISALDVPEEPSRFLATSAAAELLTLLLLFTPSDLDLTVGPQEVGLLSMTHVVD